MHAAAHDYVARFASDDELVVIDIGSRDINGSVRDLFPNAGYIGIDVAPGNGVDVVASGVDYKPKPKADIVVCCEVFEHTSDWRAILSNVARNMLKRGGRVIVTAAGINRQPHSAIDGGPVRPDEFYENIDADDLLTELERVGFSDVEIDERGDDVRATGVL